MEIIGKLTDHITDAEIRSIYDLFESVFHKRRTVAAFREQFGNTSRGYSYHALAMDGNRVVGHNAYVPFTYVDGKGTRFELVLSIDAMIHPDYRGKGIYRAMLMECERQALADGCKIRVGFPNDNSYPVQVHGFRYSDIGLLNTYCLPVRVSALNGKLRFLDPFSRCFSKIMLMLSHIGGGTRNHTFAYAKERASFDTYRYKWFGGGYSTVNLPDGGKAVYKSSGYQGTQATFLMDVYPLSRRNFDAAVREICRIGPDIKLILYVGRLPFMPLSMVKIPAAIAPKKFHFVGKVLDPTFFDGADVLDIRNWELNLSNYDLL